MESGGVFSTELSGAFGDVPFGTRSLKLQDYYTVLGLDRSASLSEIRNGYRLTAIKWHPDRAAEGMRAHALSQFQLAAEAFSVLGDPERRIVYDRHGHRGLLCGIQGTAVEGARTSVDAMEVYETFFGSVSPFADIVRERGESAKKKANSEGPAVEHTLEISLEEAVRGTTKEISLEENRLFKVTVTPGTVNGTVLSYVGMGASDAESSKPGPLLVTVRFGPQEGLTMSPEGSGDLHYTKSVGLWEAFLGITLDLPDLTSDASTVATSRGSFDISGRDDLQKTSQDLLVWEDLPQQVVEEVIIPFIVDAPVELMAIALVNRAMLQRVHRMLREIAHSSHVRREGESGMSRFCRLMGTLAQWPRIHLMREADIQAPEPEELAIYLKENPSSPFRIELRNGLPASTTFYCTVCHSPVLLNAGIISDNYHGGRGPAFLVDRVFEKVISEEALAYNTTFTTGRYVVCNVTCGGCDAAIGKKYLACMDPSNSFKTGKYLIEQAALYVPLCCRRSLGILTSGSLGNAPESAGLVCSRCLAGIKRLTAEAILAITNDCELSRMLQLYELMQEQHSLWSEVPALMRSAVQVVRSSSEGTSLIRRAMGFVVGDHVARDRMISKNEKLGERIERLSECLARMLVCLLLSGNCFGKETNLTALVTDRGLLDAISKVVRCNPCTWLTKEAYVYDQLVILERLLCGLSPAFNDNCISLPQAELFASEIWNKWLKSTESSLVATRIHRASFPQNTMGGLPAEESRVIVALDRLRRSSALHRFRVIGGGTGITDKAVERRLFMLVTVIANMTEGDSAAEEGRVCIRRKLGAILGLKPESQRQLPRSTSVDLCGAGNAGFCGPRLFSRG
ncbi:j-protein (type III) [Perkinsus chesapeaki]|uniref:J-protein (Type III) n=1 Tax=Perkinsus chesapeaki TaxID=330153 RepID=A0A7J6KXT1_PERCH|nr:j-protein (type III) [Perkinsus chesapeaki]